MLFTTAILVLAASLSHAQQEYTEIQLPTKCQTYSRKADKGIIYSLDCPEGKVKDAGLCYNPCREGYKGVGPVCWKGIKAYGRGAGTAMQFDCPEGIAKTLLGFYCFKKCPEHYIATTIGSYLKVKAKSTGDYCSEDPDYFKCELGLTADLERPYN